MNSWNVVGEKWPQKYRMVLVATDKFEGSAPAINVGYMKFAAGDLECPYFVCPGAQRGFKPLYWSDCLGDDFAPPNWEMEQPSTLTDAYRNIDCPNCDRRRVQADGVCEKCLWDVDGNDYASITKPDEYDAQGYVFHKPDENLIL